jgi:RNA ligase
MNYEFPIINSINDVLPHIEGREEFVVAEREGYTVINYAVAMEDTFPPIKVAGGSAKMREERSLTNRMRRECRGLIFDPAGNIMSRPFHKFFNIGEREETLPKNIDLSKPHTVMEKMDGSMIRPLLLDGHLRLATKMGVTEVAMNAESWLAARGSNAAGWMRTYVENGATPLFEWTSRKNQIVLDYAEDDLVLLAIRDNITGEYLDINDLDCPFTVVPRYGSVEGNLKEYLDRAREQKGREGDIIRFADGHMVKVKNDWYVRIHKTLDRIRYDRNIVALILNEELDDAAPLLPDYARDRVLDFYARFSKRLHELVESYDRYWNTVVASGLDRKRYAQEWMPSIKSNDPFAPNYVFGRFTGRDGRAMILDHIEKHLTTNVKWDECARWMGL